MTEGFALDTDIPKEIRVETEEVNAGGARPQTMRDLQVEFGIYRDGRGHYKVYNMTLPEDIPLTTDALEKRVHVQGPVYTGQIVTWVYKWKYGYIEPEDRAVFPPDVNAKLAQMARATLANEKKIEGAERAFYVRQSDCRPGFEPEERQTVSFQIYIDDKGAGALDVDLIAHAPPVSVGPSDLGQMLVTPGSASAPITIS